ncbi:MAG: hypothetical protein JW785_05200 [Acidimicrobiia bacterium]|nr:hypothetical protein [Acidimicrobiia bacterium]
MRPELPSPPTRRRRLHRIAFLLVALALLAAACGNDGASEVTAPRDATDPTALGFSGPDHESATFAGDEDESSTTTTVPSVPCPLPQPLPADVGLDPSLVNLHRDVTAFAESAIRMRDAIRATGDFSAGWGAREPVASAFFRMQADLYALARRLERTYQGDGATYSPETGWVFPEGPYPPAALASPWEAIPEFQAVALTRLFEIEGRARARAFFEQDGVCPLVAAFSAAVDQAAAESTA